MNFIKTKNISIVIYSVMVSALLAGCAATPTTARSVESGSNIDIESQTSTQPKPVFNVSPPLSEDSTLSDYLRLAALNNPGLEAAFYRWKAALEKVPQATSLPDPKFNYGYFIREVETRVGPQEQKIGIAQTFPWFGKLKLRGERAGEAAIVAREQYEDTKVDLFYKVKETYYELYYLSKAISITKENMELLKHLESVAQAKFRAGSDVTGVVKAQVELGKLEDSLLSLEDLKTPIVAKLNVAMNRPVDEEIPWPKNFTTSDVNFTDQEVIAILDEGNPELLALAAKVSEEKKSLALAKKEFWPDVTVGVDYLGTGDARMSGVTDSGKDAVMVTGAINIPLWWGKYRAGVREAQARRNGAIRSLENRENVLESDLKMSLYKFHDAKRKISLFGKTLTPLAKNSLEVAEQAYETGKADFLQLIDAQRLLLDIQLSHQRALTDREQRLAEIEMLIGRDLLP
jgi:outer membrane protein TolC